MNTHTIGTYNMSFMSDLTAPIGPKMAFASEGAFLARLYGDEPGRRSFWENAKGLLRSFIIDESPCAIGLQEINKTEGTNTGSDAIDQMLLEFPNYKQICRNVPTNNAGVSIIFNTETLGDDVESVIIDNPNQAGRPILMVLTSGGYLLISIHGAQNPGLRLNQTAFNEYMINNNKNTIESKASEFIQGKNISQIFIMGDFNDRYDAIKNININGMTATYSGTAPKSCCYNWDSSCEDADLEDGGFSCKEPASMKNATGMKISLDARGATKNYKYAGDKVFGLNPSSDMVIYRPSPHADGISKESDHELIYASFGVNSNRNKVNNSGGRRTRKTHRKLKRKRKTRRRN